MDGSPGRQSRPLPLPASCEGWLWGGPGARQLWLGCSESSDVAGPLAYLSACGRCRARDRCQITTECQADQSPLQCPPLDQDVPTTGATAQTDIRAQPVDEPLLATTWVGATQLHGISEPKLDDWRLIPG